MVKSLKSYHIAYIQLVKLVLMLFENQYSSSLKCSDVVENQAVVLTTSFIDRCIWT